MGEDVVGVAAHSEGERDKLAEASRRRSRRLADVARSQSARTELVVVHGRRISDAKGSLWFKPALSVFGALALGAALSRVRVTSGDVLWSISFHASANDARQMLTVIIGALIPVTSLVFALTVVTLQIASTQFSPRLLRTFLRDGGTQLVLSAFVGTVSYSLAVLFTVNTEATGGSDPVPRFAITVALIFALISIGMLVYYIGHITNAVRIDTIMRQVEGDTRCILYRDHPLIGSHEADPDRVEVLEVPEHAVTVFAPNDGYLQGVDAKLLPLTIRKQVTVQVVQTVGYYVVAGRPLAQVWCDDGSPLKATTMAAIARLIEIDPERRVENDVGLGLRQLVDITNRAMSTGQNDPYTGTQAVHHLTSLLVEASQRSFATHTLCDADGKVRVVLPMMSFPTLLKVVCGHIRQGGLERHPRVVQELLRMLGTVGDSVPSAARARAVRREVEVVMTDARRMIATPEDLEEVLRDGAQVLARLDALTTPAYL